VQIANGADLWLLAPGAARLLPEILDQAGEEPERGDDRNTEHGPEEQIRD